MLPEEEEETARIQDLSCERLRSFAYLTVRDRLPVILTKVIDTVYQYRIQAAQKYGEAATEDCKTIVAHLSQFKNEMQTDKPIMPLRDTEQDDLDIWHRYYEEEKTRYEEELPSWFKSSWLYVECYMYRRIMEAIHLSNALPSFDPFGEQKRKAFLQSLDAITLLGNYLEQQTNQPVKDFQQAFNQFIQISLWGNKCDLSISAGIENSQKIDPLSPLQTLQDNIIANDIHKLWPVLAGLKTPITKVRLDIVLDNAGFELFTDLCLAEFALRASVVDVVYMHCKAMPWFVSDVTYQDFMWTIDTLQNHKDNILSSLGKSWHRRLSAKTWVISGHKFWTTPHDYSQMKLTAPDLYQDLRQSNLILFKGDLNYRKLVGDRSWKPTIPYVEALCSFHPAPHCALRTCKADLIVGLREGLSEELSSKDKDWMIKGEYAVIQYCAIRDSL